MRPSQQKPHKSENGDQALKILFASTVAVVYIVYLIADPHGIVQPQGAALLVLGVLYAVVGTFGDSYRERLDTRAATIVYFVIQLCLIAAYVFVSQAIGVFWLVPLPLIAQATVTLPRSGVAAVAAAVIAIVAFVGVLNVDRSDAILSTLMYTVAVAFVIAFSHLLVRERRARAQVEHLATELRETNRQLEAHAAQAEELAAIRERNNLARELHDSATQTIFSITLTAEAARLLLERDPAQVGPALQRLHDLSKCALDQMRSLVHHLRLQERNEALAPALHRHIAELQAREGLTVNLAIRGDPDLSGHQVAALFRIVQEALNNVVRHARTDSAEVSLHARPDRVRVVVRDNGAGFDPKTVADLDGHYGLTGMRERAELLGATLSIDSAPGAGTEVAVALPLPSEG